MGPEDDDDVLDADGLAEVVDSGPVPLPRPRSLIPADVLEAIAEEEAAFLAGEKRNAAQGKAEPTRIIELGSDEEIHVVSEQVDVHEATATLGHTDLFRHLGVSAREQLAAGAIRYHLQDRQTAFAEGSPAGTFFVVEAGTMEAVKVGHDTPEIALAHLGPGQVFGLFGVLARHTRAATVRSIGEASVLELDASPLDGLLREDATARTVFARFFKERLLENFLAASGLFSGLDALGRAALISHFHDRRCMPGEAVLSPGEVQNGLWVVTSGHLQVIRRVGSGKEQELARVGRGQFLGAVSAMSGLPMRVQVNSPEATTLCVLPQKSFNEFVKGYPTLRQMPQRLAETATQLERDLFVGDATLVGH